jgi:hypothetical protein
MGSRPIMVLKSLCIMHLARYLFQKPPTNFSDEAKIISLSIFALTGDYVDGTSNVL